MSKILEHKAALCNQLRRLAIEAGEITLDHFEESGFDGSDIKGDGSPVTIADRQAEAFIEKNIRDILPDIPFIGEEAFTERRADKIGNSDYFWLVDALDGTKEFISGSGDFTVNIALIKGNTPVLGVVYLPVTGVLYGGFGPDTAFKWSDDSGVEKRIETRLAPKAGLTVVSSKSHGSATQLDDFLDSYKVKKIIKKGSSLKICTIAEGKADIYPRFGPTCEWDIAAADAILRSAGGIITNTNNQDMVYRKENDKFLNPEFIAWSGDLIPRQDNDY